MASASTPSVNKPVKDLSFVHTAPQFVHTAQLKPMIKAQISGRKASSCIIDVAIASVNSEKTHLKKLMMMKMIIIITEKSFTSK